MASFVIQGTVVPRQQAGSPSTAGYAVEVRMLRSITLAPDDPSEILTAPATGNTRVGADQSFRLEIGGEGDPLGPVDLTVSAPDGTRVATRQLTLAEAAKTLKLTVETVELHAVTPVDDPALGQLRTLVGRVVDATGRPVPADLPVVLWGAPLGQDGADLLPLVITETQLNGYFSAPWPARQLVRAEGRVAGQPPVPIPLDDKQRLPETVLLVHEFDLSEDGVECQCAEEPPRAPDQRDLTSNPAAFSQDLGGGCVDLNTPNRTVEEFAYRFVVRTSEPKVKGLTLGVRRTVPPQLLGDLLGVALASDIMHARLAPATMAANTSASFKLDVQTARHLVRSDRPPTVADVDRASWLSEVGHTKQLIDASIRAATGRGVLNGSNPIDWDETPTIHQAVELSHGHVLHFREVWRADGFSLGDLLYSLPLAPGQRRRIAIVDWEWRSRSSRSESLEFEEHLDAFLGRDRDVTEIVGSSLHEETAGGSRSTTWGVAGGIGAGFITGGFGIFGGVAGGAGGSSSSAWQRSSRTFAADSMQRLRDRVTQRASSVRDQRSTVVQTVAQGETLRAETEVVANYNRCHALTVEYFEVLRHFLVSHELVDVSECLFVPFPLAEFDRGKALRWREPLGRFLRERRLANGFTALRRVADNWVGWDYPEARYSEEAPESLEGELRLSFVLPRPRDDTDGKYQIDMWQPWRGLLPVDTLELWTANMNERTARERDRYYRTEVAPEIAARLVQRLRFAYVTDRGGEIEVPLDPTLVSRYVEGIPLYVTINPSGPPPSVPREDIAYFKIWYDGAELPPDARVIAHAGKVRYRSPHSTGVLFAADRILDDVGTGDPVVIPTPVSRWELRNPREEDRDLADRLVAHLNEHLEFYHQAIWVSLDAGRRYMLLDSILVPGLDGQSVASVCANDLIGIAGNSLVLPLAPGQRLDPTLANGAGDAAPAPLIDAYNTNPLPATRVSVPTRGVYAEAIAGACHACEAIDDSRYWRWMSEGLLEAPAIDPVSTATRTPDGDPDLKPTPLPTPLVSIQNAPAVPEPASLADAFGLLATKNLFADITGLEGSQKNAMAAFEASMAAASALGGEASKLASQNELGRNASRMLDRIDQARKDDLLSSGAAQDLSRSVLQGMIGESRPTDAPPTKDGAVQKVVDEAAQSPKAQIKVSSPAETVEVAFDDDAPRIGAAPTAGQLDLGPFVGQDVIIEEVDWRPAAGSRKFAIPAGTRSLAGLRGKLGGGPDAAAEVAWLTTAGFIQADPADPSKFQALRRLRIVYPVDPKNPKKVAPGGRMPVVAIVHGNHAYHDGVNHVSNHEGYTYLQQELAAQGIVSVSVDTNLANALDSLIDMRAESVLGALDTMRAMDRDSASIFHNRLDLDRVGMMGHSRGGDAVVRAAIRNATRSPATRFGVKAVCALAPTDFSGTAVDAAVNRLTAAQTPFFLVVYGELDGDVAGQRGATGVGGTGFRHYDRAATDKAMIFLEHCTHNRFNDVWSTDESGILPTDSGRLVSRPDHRTLANEYIGGLFRWRLLGDGARRGLLDGSSLNSVGAKVSVQWSFGQSVSALDSFESATPEAGTRAMTGAGLSAMAAAATKRPPFGDRTNHQTRALVVAPDVPGPPPLAYKLTLPAASRNWSGFDLLTFRVATDADVSTKPKTDASAFPDFTVVLTDTAGGSAVITAAALRTPDVRPRRPVFHELQFCSKRDPATGACTKVDTENCTAIRLETLAIELSKLTGIDRSKVATVAVSPPVLFPEFQFFDSIQLVKR